MAKVNWSVGGDSNCACCSSCPEITSDYIVISEAMYNALGAGGSVSGSGGGSEYTGCSFSGTVGGYIVPPCSGSVSVNGGVTCSVDGEPFTSTLAISWEIAKVEIAKVGTEYRIHYSGGGSCFSDIHSTTLGREDCYTVGFFISSGFDAVGAGQNFLTQVGTGTIATSAESLSFGIYNLDPSATASLDITITPSP